MHNEELVFNLQCLLFQLFFKTTTYLSILSVLFYSTKRLDLRIIIDSSYVEQEYFYIVYLGFMSGCRVIINIQFSFIRAEFRIPLPDNCGTTIVYHHHSADVLQTKIQLTKQRNPNDIVVRITLPVIPDASPPGGLVLIV